MTFLPEKYEIPASGSSYMRFEQGDNTFRVLSSAIIGWEGWVEEKDEQGKSVRRPKRFRMNDKPTDLREFDKQRLSHFWAFVVWNHKAEAVQILEITQKGIQQDIQALVANEKWGDPKGYDITVTRNGTDLDTKYSTMPNPHTEVPASASEALKQRPINLEALYYGKDPFNQDEEIPSEDDEIPFD